jgi:hypothetical protein
MNSYSIRQDEYDVDFDDTRSHTALRWREMVQAASESLSPVDQKIVHEPRDWVDVAEDIQRMATDHRFPASMRRTLMGIQPLPRTLSNLTKSFAYELTPETIELNSLWGLMYLNVKVLNKTNGS